MTSSPGSSRPSIAAIIASVAPQVTVTCVSGSIVPQPGKCRGVVSAIASRSGLAPQVIAYWLRSSSTASATASLSSGGQAKSGKPWARLTAPAADGQPVHLADDRFGEPVGLGGDPSTVGHGGESIGAGQRQPAIRTCLRLRSAEHRIVTMSVEHRRLVSRSSFGVTRDLRHRVHQHIDGQARHRRHAPALRPGGAG